MLITEITSEECREILAKTGFGHLGCSHPLDSANRVLDVDWITAKVAMGLLEGSPLHGDELIRSWQIRAQYAESLRRREVEAHGFRYFSVGRPAEAEWQFRVASGELLFLFGVAALCDAASDRRPSARQRSDRTTALCQG